MIGPPSGVKVLVATKPVDFRKGMDGLALLVKEEMKADPFSGVVYVFRAKRADRVKMLWWDGSGVVLYAKRLEQGAFRWPKVGGGEDGAAGRFLVNGEPVSEGKKIMMRPGDRVLLETPGGGGYGPV